MNALDWFLSPEQPPRGPRSGVLADLASRQSQAKESGYSKISGSFALRRVVAWLCARLPALDPSVEVTVAGDAEATPASAVRRFGNHTVISGLNRQTVKSQDFHDAASNITLHNCSGSYIYLLGAVRHVNIVDCHRTTVVLGAVGGVVSATSCRSLELHAACGIFKARACAAVTAFLCCALPPLLLEGTIDVTLAPLASCYPGQAADLQEAGLEPNVNMWNQPLVCGLQCQSIPRRARRGIASRVA